MDVPEKEKNRNPITEYATEKQDSSQHDVDNDQINPRRTTKNRTSGRKSLNPTKLVKRYNCDISSKLDCGQEDQHTGGADPPWMSRKAKDESVDCVATADYSDGGGEEADAGEETGGSLLIQPVKWGKRMRLSISKDLTKMQRKQPQPTNSAIGDSVPTESQQVFTCFICQQPFLDAANCYNHMVSHNVGFTQLGALPQGKHRQKQSEIINEQGDLIKTEADGMDLQDAQTEEGFSGSQDFQGLDHDSVEAAVKGLQTALDQGETDKGFECQQCGKRFMEQRGLSQHLRVHARNKSLICTICNKVLPSYSLLTEHKRSHAGERPFKCGFVGCDRYFADGNQARRHGRMHSKECPFVCPQCDKAFKAQDDLTEHLRVHTGEHPYVCEVCGLGFGKSGELKLHSKQHDQQDDNECDSCHKTFAHPHSLVLHKQSHLSDKPYSCELCGKTFRTSCNLGAHRKLKHLDENQTEEKVFTCTDCGATFHKACNLGIHRKKKHSDLPAEPAKIFVCNVCDARFAEACNLGAHKKIKHAEETGSGRAVFDCPICGAQFFRACNLSGHMRRKHKGQSAEGNNSERRHQCQLCGILCFSSGDLQDHYSTTHASLFRDAAMEARADKDVASAGTEKAAAASSSADRAIAAAGADIMSAADQFDDEEDASVHIRDAAVDLSESHGVRPKSSSTAGETKKTQSIKMAHRAGTSTTLVDSKSSETLFSQSTSADHLQTAKGVQIVSDSILPGLQQFMRSMNNTQQNDTSYSQCQSVPSSLSSQQAQGQNSINNINRTSIYHQQNTMYQQNSWNSQQFPLSPSFSKSVDTSCLQPSLPSMSSSFSQRTYQQPAIQPHAGVSVPALDNFLQNYFNIQ